MRQIDGFLSNKAQSIWRGAMVFSTSSPDTASWVLERPATDRRQALETLALGKSFHEAQQALNALIAAQRARGNGQPCRACRRQITDDDVANAPESPLPDGLIDCPHCGAIYVRVSTSPNTFGFGELLRDRRFTSDEIRHAGYHMHDAIKRVGDRPLCDMHLDEFQALKSLATPATGPCFMCLREGAESMLKKEREGLRVLCRKESPKFMHYRPDVCTLCGSRQVDRPNEIPFFKMVSATQGTANYRRLFYACGAEVDVPLDMALDREAHERRFRNSHLVEASDDKDSQASRPEGL